MVTTRFRAHYGWEEWLSLAERANKPRRSAWPPFDTSSEDRNERAGGWTFTEALEAARGAGYSEAVPEAEALARTVADQITTERLGTTFQATWAVAGAEVDMGRFMSGEPECMVETVPVQIAKHGRAVRLVVPSNQACNIGADTIRARGAAIMALCDVLTRLQHPLEVWAAFNNNGTDPYRRTALLVKVQGANEPLDAGRLMLAVAHPASNRRLAWAAKNAIVDDDDTLAQAFDVKGRGGYGGGGREAYPEDLPDEQGAQTIILPSFDRQSDWSPEAAERWVIQTIEQVFRTD